MSARLTRALMSDHRLTREADRRRENRYLAAFAALVAVSFVLKVFGVL